VAGARDAGRILFERFSPGGKAPSVIFFSLDAISPDAPRMDEGGGMEVGTVRRKREANLGGGERGGGHMIPRRADAARWIFVARCATFGITVPRRGGHRAAADPRSTKDDGIGRLVFPDFIVYVLWSGQSDEDIGVLKRAPRPQIGRMCNSTFDTDR
jgi:hypothetical protein